MSNLILNRNSYIGIVLLGCIAGIHTEIIVLIAVFLWIIINYQKCYKLSRRWISFFLFLFLHGIILLSLLGYSCEKFLQQFVLLSLTYLLYYQIFRFCKLSADKWFQVYLKVVYFISVVGLFTFVVKCITGMDIFPYTFDGVKTQSTYRLHAFLAEAGSFVVFTIPAVSYIFLSPYYFIENKKKSLLILVAFILTLSTSAVVALFTIFIIKLYKSYKYFRLLLLICIVGGTAWLSVNYYQLKPSETVDTNSGFGAVQLKIYETLTVLENATPYDFESLNLSSYATLTNYWIAFNAPSRLFGTGLGTHSQNYESLYKSSFDKYGLNKDDGYSLFARLFSEFGLIGICVYVLFLIKCYNKDNLISICLLVFFVSYLIKGGHYTLYGTALFHFLYYMVYKSSKNKKNESYDFGNHPDFR